VMTKKRNHKQQATNRARAKKQQTGRPEHKPFIEHLRELRTRLVFVCLAIIAGASAAYPLRQTIIDFLVAPAGEQQFIFTSPTGGFDFVFKVCIAAGVVASIPVIIFNLLRYLQPLFPKASLKTATLGMLFSVFLAFVGMTFAYTVGLPAALNFLLQTFLTGPVEALITIQAYMSFVVIYMLGAALIFQIPLVLLFINRIKPLRPSKLFKQQRWVILISFIIAVIITPTPDVASLLILAIPMIIMYQLGIVLIMIANRRGRYRGQFNQLLEQDKKLQAERLEEFQKAQAELSALLGSKTTKEQMSRDRPS
jgi:sec-independent protein translocase protein TatC